MQGGCGEEGKVGQFLRVPTDEDRQIDAHELVQKAQTNSRIFQGSRGKCFAEASTPAP